MPLSMTRWLRRPALRALRLFPIDISIRNPWDRRRKVHLNLYRHKGYWYYGKERERLTMSRFAEVIKPGDTVYEIGGHIGFITQYFSKLTGDRGQVIVFEPGKNNLPYISRNVSECANVRLEQYAISDRSGPASFHVENLTGQNNSLMDHFRFFDDNVAMSYSKTDYRIETVECITLDEFVVRGNPPPNFIKIDIEGAELLALNGMQNILANDRPVLMVETTRHSNDEVEKLLREAGYQLEDENGRRRESFWDYVGNMFCYPT